jgi:hypothetical protein
MKYVWLIFFLINVLALIVAVIGLDLFGLCISLSGAIIAALAFIRTPKGY